MGGELSAGPPDPRRRCPLTRRGRGAYAAAVCRSIVTLRPPYVPEATAEDVHAAALQYVRKVSGFRRPADHNAAAFDRAVDAVAAATAELLDSLEVRGHGRAAPP